jgi:hypothetical protein
MAERVMIEFVELASRWLEDGATTRSVAEDLGVSTTAVRRNADHWGLPKLQHRLGGDSLEEWNPTPEEIKAECEMIQATWSPEERLARDCYAVQRIYRDPTNGNVRSRATGFSYLEGV